MPFAFFKIASDADSDAASDLNRFLATHRSVTVTRQWVERDGAWAFCVEYTALTGSDSARPPGAGKVDYREILPPEQFEIFARLRLVRKALAGRDGLPVFAVFSNEQLAEIVRRGCDSLAALKEIAGLGEQRVTKYGADVLAAGGGVTGSGTTPQATFLPRTFTRVPMKSALRGCLEQLPE